MSNRTKPARRMGEDPLDSFVPPRAEAAPRASRKGLAASKGEIASPPEEKRPEKVRATFHIPTDIFEAARDAVVFLSGPPHRLTLASFAETALRRELERLEKEHHQGKPFPPRQGELKGGRPIKA